MDLCAAMMYEAIQAVGSVVNFNLATQVVAGLVAGQVCFAAGVYAYTQMTCGVCTCTTYLDGRTVVVTGANTGIGYYAALDFAKRKARVIVAGRNSGRIEAAARAIRDATGNAQVVARLLDVSLMKSVRAFVKEFIETEERLDILVNNAGIAGSRWMDLTRTEEGLELIMATNHLGHFLLTNLLLDVMKKSAPSRIISVSSLMHSWPKKLDVDNLNGCINFNAGSIYSETKLCNVLFTRELAQRLKGTGVTTYSLHPGIVTTEKGRNARWPLNWSHRMLSIFLMKSTEQGAQTTIHCAVAPGMENHSGKYFSDCKLAKMGDLAKDDSLARNVWDASTRLVSL